MRQYIFFIILFSASLSVAAQDSIAQLWEKANAHYTTENYAEAASLYEEIISNGQVSAKIYFNLGNAYYKLGDANNAILNYERAKTLAPNDEDIEFNLSIVNQFVVTKTEELPKPFFVRWRNSVIDMHSADNWAMMSIAAFILFLLLLGFFVFSKNSAVKKLSFWIGIIAVVFSGFTYSFSGQQKKEIEDSGHAIVFCPRVTVKSSPAESGTDLFLIYEGLKVQVTDSLNTWTEIRLSDGNEGWLPDSCIVKI